MVVLYPHWRTGCTHRLLGLTAEETREFQHLDSRFPVDADGRPLLEWEACEEDFPQSQKRWLELYKKHRAACVSISPSETIKT
jgi:hypothetical protein